MMAVHAMIANVGKPTTLYTREIRVRHGKVCMGLVHCCRAYLIGWNHMGQVKQSINSGTHISKKIRVTIPFCKIF